MSFLRFLLTYLDKRCDFPGGFGGQCVDAVNMYLQQVWALPPVRANAVDFAHRRIPAWQWTANGPTNYPPQGAIVVWGQDAAVGTGPFGHVAIAIDSDWRELLTFDQNWPAGSLCHFEAHTYEGVLGWQTPPTTVR